LFGMLWRLLFIRCVQRLKGLKVVKFFSKDVVLECERFSYKFGGKELKSVDKARDPRLCE